MDCLLYKTSESMYNVRNLTEVIYYIGLKYNITRWCIVNGKDLKNVNMKQTKKYICEKCFEYFEVGITLRQINSLLRPEKGKFPYTAIVIIETIYNLLEHEKDRYDNVWNEKCLQYLDKYFCKDQKFEEFMLGKLPECINNKIDDFMNTKYNQIFCCFSDSRVKFQEVFGEMTITECIEKFPIKSLGKKNIPASMYEYQAERRYIRL